MKKYLSYIIGFLLLTISFCVFFFVWGGSFSVFEENGDQALPEKNDVTFLTPAGYYETSLVVKINSNRNCKFYYTLDGRVPGENIDLESCRYVEAGEISLPLRKGNICYYSLTVRPQYEDGTLGESIFNTYVVGEGASKRFDNVAVFITCDPDKLFGYESGILVAGKLRDDWIKEHPGQNPIPISPAGFMQRGWESEREINIQFFNKEGVQVINQTAGIRPFGAYSRASLFKSVKVYARTEYDPVNNVFDFPIFGEHYALDGSGRLVTDYKRFVLRSSGSDCKGSHMRDELHQTLAINAGFPGCQHVEPISVYINGSYYGSMWAHEVISDKFFEDQYGYYEGRMGVASGPEMKKPDARYEIDTIEEDQFIYDAWMNMYNK